jgi:hypothetical protein
LVNLVIESGIALRLLSLRLRDLRFVNLVIESGIVLRLLELRLRDWRLVNLVIESGIALRLLEPKSRDWRNFAQTNDCKIIKRAHQALSAVVKSFLGGAMSFSPHLFVLCNGSPG